MRTPSESPASATAAEPYAAKERLHGTPAHLATQDGELLDERAPPDLDDDAPSDDRKSRIGFTLQVDEAAFRATLVLERGFRVLENEGQIRDQLHRQKISHGLDNNQIKLACMNLEYATDTDLGRTFEIARGTLPTEGNAAQLDFVVDVTGQAQLSERNDHDGRVDFKSMAKITTVKAGQLLARVLPAVAGVGGIALDGRHLPAPDPIASPFHLGEGVQGGGGAGEVRATTDGRPVWADETLSVLEVYEIEGDVDLNTGNIDFDGHVIVHGAILDEFIVRCKSIDVHGTVGSAVVITRQDANFRGGVNGHQKGNLRIGGDCHARYLNEVMGQIGGNLVVERGITNSNIGVIGELVAGRIVGGNSTALSGFEVGELGSDLGVVTTVQAGKDYRVDSLLSQLEGLEDSIEDLGRKAAPFIAMGAEYERLDEERQQASEDAHQALLAARARREQLETLLAGHQERADSLAVRMVNIGTQLHADVLVCIEDACREFNEATGGQWTIRRCPESGQIELGDYRRRPVTRS